MCRISKQVGDITVLGVQLGLCMGCILDEDHKYETVIYGGWNIVVVFPRIYIQ